MGQSTPCKDLMSEQASILVVDDQPDLLEGLALTLEAAGYRVRCADNGLSALALLQEHPADLIIADIAMPELNGYQLYEQVRRNKAWISIPFLFLTARSLDSDVRYGKAMGVDDYLIKPIKPEDLLASVAGRLRRAMDLARARPPSTNQPASAGSPEPDGDVLQLGRLRISTSQHRVWMDHREIVLSPREFKLLDQLGRQASQVVEPHKLIKASHGLHTDSIEAGQLLRPLIRSLRRKLGFAIGDMGCIENVRGVGYRLNPPR
jgi:DNA-binding response OmpR family regulator